MDTKLKLGIIITIDPTNKGRIPSETYYFNALYHLQKTFVDDFSIDIICMTKRGVDIVEKLSTPTLDETEYRFFDFPHNVVLVSDDEKIEETAKKYDVLLCQKTYAMPFGGRLAKRCIDQYKLMSLFTGKYNKPIMFRISDCEEDYVDYLKMAQFNIPSFERNIKPKDPEHYDCIEHFTTTQEYINYENVYWLVNGSYKFDWLPDAMLNRKTEGPIKDLVSEETVRKNTIHLSDDIFFLVKENYEKYSYLNGTAPTVNSFCFIGFLNWINKHRVTVFKKLFKEFPEGTPPIHLFGEIDTDKFKTDNPNVTIEKGFIPGNSKEYFEFLNKYIAYVFIGKGRENIAYVGKTCYDAMVARTPIVVYSQCDMNRVLFPDNPEFYFDDIKGLSAIFQTLQDNDVRSKWVDIQTEIIFREFDIENANFSKLK